MKDMIVNSVFFGAAITLISYQIGVYLNRKFKLAIINPILVAEICIIVVLLAFKIDFKSYNIGAQYISYLITPATVCLAIPLYEELTHLKNNWKAIMAGIISGTATSAVTILALSIIFRLSHQQYVTLLPKSITVAIGMGVSEELGGIVAITIAIIIITGLIGNVLGEFILDKFKIHHPIAKGVALGASSHVLGTARAMEIGELEGAISSLSLAVSGLLTVIVASVFANFL